MVSLVPPVPGSTDGKVRRTLPKMLLIAWPAVGFPIADLGSTRVIVPSALALLAASRFPSVVNTRLAPWNTPVEPYVNAGAAPSEVTIDTNQSSCGPTTGSSGGFCGEPKRTAQRHPAGTVERFATLIEK